MKFYIDGYNLMYEWGAPGGGKPFELRKARETLLARLSRFAVDGGHEITVVFDGQPGILNWPHGEGPEITVIFSKRGSADDALIERIERQTKRNDLAVVSSDNRIRKAARHRGLTEITSEGFLKLLHSRPELEEDVDPGSREYRLPPNEVEAWLKEFGLDKEK